MKIPCKECLTLAICRQREWVKCTIAGEYCFHGVDVVNSRIIDRATQVKDFLNKKRWSFGSPNPTVILYNRGYYKGQDK